MIGTVKFYMLDRHFGFVVPDDGSPDCFLHQAALRNAGLETLNPGDRISFNARADRFGRKGPVAIDIVKLDEDY
jgi:CspA family cold shock protein